MTPTYVTFEQGKFLKDKGFIQTNIMGHTTKWYDNRGNLRGHGVHGKSNVPAPQQWEVVEWLRITHNIDVHHVIVAASHYGYNIFQNRNRKHKEEGYYLTPQEAYSEAFNYILKELI